MLPDTDALYRAMGSIPKIARGKVWCKTCGRSKHVDGEQCLRHGWPKCCGYTMTIDSPAERSARRDNGDGMKVEGWDCADGTPEEDHDW